MQTLLYLCRFFFFTLHFALPLHLFILSFKIPCSFTLMMTYVTLKHVCQYIFKIKSCHYSEIISFANTTKKKKTFQKYCEVSFTGSACK